MRRCELGKEVRIFLGAVTFNAEEREKGENHEMGH
jgi:hypothetical protein